ncbi:MAG: AhpC/TSA family protein [Bacteroidales bacterium]|nr:AhpC/TSA family protein [Candidatus Sodaliphilus fimicaballi]
MKKLLMIAAAALAMASCSNTQQYKVAVLFPDAESDGQTAYLTSYDSGDTLAQAEIKNKNAVLEGEVEGSFMARLVVDGKRMGFIVEGGEITIKWEEGEAKGTALNEKLNALDAELNKVEDEAAQVAIFQKAYLENKDNGIGPWAFNYYLMCNDFTVAQIDSMLTALPENYKTLKRVNKAISDAKAKEATGVGKQFTDFANDKGEKLSQFAGQGKYCLVDFWASWCGPCRKEIGNIKKLYAKYSDKMNFVGIAVWDEDEATVKAMEELQVVWPVIMNGKNWTVPTDLYGVSGIPHIMLIDPQGKIVKRGLQEETLINAVEELFAEK